MGYIYCVFWDLNTFAQNEFLRFLKFTVFFFQLPEPMIAKTTFKNFDTQLIFGPRRECNCVKKHGRFMKSRNTKEFFKYIYLVMKIVLTYYCEKKKKWSRFFSCSFLPLGLQPQFGKKFEIVATIVYKAYTVNDVPGKRPLWVFPASEGSFHVNVA